MVMYSTMYNIDGLLANHSYNVVFKVWTNEQMYTYSNVRSQYAPPLLGGCGLDEGVCS